MPTTTLADIREAMATALDAVTPDSFGNYPFRRYREDGERFREWAQQNPAASTRMFSIRAPEGAGGAGTPESSGGDVEWVTRDFECVVAYPRDWRPGNQGALSLDDVIEADERLVVKTIGTYGYQQLEASVGTAAATVTHLPADLEDRGPCRFLVLPLTVSYWRSLGASP